MKKSLLIIGILTIILLLTSCLEETVTLPPQTTSQPTETSIATESTPEYIETIVYDESPVDYEAYSGDEGGLDQPRPDIEDFKINGIPKELHFYTELGIGPTLGIEKSQDKSAEAIKTVNFANKEWNLKYIRTEITQYKVHNTEMGDYSTQWDIYRDENETVEFVFDSETGNIINFELLMQRKIPTFSFDTKAAVKSANELITSIFGENSLNGYELAVRTGVAPKRIDIEYKKYIGGVYTGDYICVYYGFDGVLEGFYAKQFGLFNHLKTEVSPKRIEDSRTALLSALPAGTQLQEFQRLFIDAHSGKCYIELYPIYPKDLSNTYPDQFYINVN